MLIPLLLTALAAAPTPSPDGQDGVVTTAPATGVILDGAAAPSRITLVAGAVVTTPSCPSGDGVGAAARAVSSKGISMGSSPPGNPP